MAMDKGKPGVMIYFEMGKSVRGLDYETKGRLFDAILDYAENGTLPSFDGVLSAVWPFVMNGIDRDSANYADKVLKRRRAAYAKWWDDYARENGIDPEDRDAKERWIYMQMHAKDANASGALQTHANACNGMQTMPTTTPTPTPTTTPTPTPATNTAHAKDANASGALQRTQTQASGTRRRGGNIFMDILNEGM